MFKLFVLIGMVILFNVLSRVIENTATPKDNKKPTGASDDSLDNVWDNLERMAKERKAAENLAQAKSTSKKEDRTTSYKLNQQESKSYKRDDLKYSFAGSTGEPKKAPKPKEEVVDAAFDDMDFFSDYSPKEKKIVKPAPKKTVSPYVVKNDEAKKDQFVPSVSTDGNTKYDFLKKSFDAAPVSEISSQDLSNDDITKTAAVSFSKEDVLQGIIFSEILGKPKAKRKIR